MKDTIIDVIGVEIRIFGTSERDTMGSDPFVSLSQCPIGPK